MFRFRPMPWFWFPDLAAVMTGPVRAIGALGLVALGLVAQAFGLWVLVQFHARGEHLTPMTVLSESSRLGGHSLGPPRIPALRLPIDGVPIPQDASLLPGARRDYRGGVHEGVDFRCAPGTPVRAAVGGTILWVNAEPDVPPAVRSRLLERCRKLERTPDEVLNALHGRRIVICAVLTGGELLTTSYSHLGGVRRDLVPGRTVQAGEVIAWTGNSGTSHAARHDGWGELHFETRIDGVPLGAGLAPSEAGELYRAAFRGGN